VLWCCQCATIVQVVLRVLCLPTIVAYVSLNTVLWHCHGSSPQGRLTAYAQNIFKVSWQMCLDICLDITDRRDICAWTVSATVLYLLWTAGGFCCSSAAELITTYGYPTECSGSLCVADGNAMTQDHPHCNVKGNTPENAFMLH
jgi:hypothetical protein